VSVVGRSVAVCRARHQAAPLVDALRSVGVLPIHVPLLSVQPPLDGGRALHQALLAADESTWLAITSGNGVDAVAAAVENGSALPTRIAVVGAASAIRAEAHGWAVDHVSPESSAAGLGRSLPARPGERVIAAVAELASDDLARALADRGIAVDVVTSYRTVAPDVSRADLDRILEADAIVVTAPSVIDRLSDLVGTTDLPALVAIGGTTASAIARHGLAIAAIADEPTIDGLIDAVVRTLDP